MPPGTTASLPCSSTPLLTHSPAHTLPWQAAAKPIRRLCHRYRYAGILADQKSEGKGDMATHRIASTPETVRWGVFDAGFSPLITVNSGDTVVLECVSGGPEVMPPAGSGLTIPPALAAIHAGNVPRAP